VININGRFLAQRITGPQRYAHEVVRRLIRTRGTKNVKVLVPPYRDPVPKEFVAATSRGGRLRGHPWEQLELGRLANKNGGVLWSPVNVGPVSAKRHVITIHDVFSIQFPRWVGKRFHLWYSLLLPKLASAASQIITVSEYSKVSIVETLRVPEEKVSVIYPGVDARFGIVGNDEVLRVRQKYGLPAHFVLTLGPLQSRKNLERVVDAWLQLDDRDKSPLVIAGGLGARRVYGSYYAGGLRQHRNITLLGYVPEEDLPGLYTSATVFVYASLLEGFGLPPLEAMACGATVVTSRTSAMRETSEGEAFMVEPTSVGSIAEGIARAYRTDQTTAEQEERAERVKKKFNWTSTTEQVAAILERHE
jgi:glycosyltransferase involved in cell wall biosynthesis